MVFERGCAAAGRCGPKGNEKGAWCWRGDTRRRALRCFLAVLVLLGIFFGYNRRFRPEGAVTKEVGEKSNEEGEGSELEDHRDGEARHFENITGPARGTSSCLPLRDGALAEKGRRKGVCKSVGEGGVPVLMEDSARGDGMSRVLGIRANCGKTPLVKAEGLGPWEEEHFERSPLRVSTEVEEFLLKKYRCRERQCPHQAIIWPAGCVAGAVGERPDEEKTGALGVTSGGAGGRLPSHAIRRVHLLIKPVEKKGSTSTVAGRRTVGRMFRWIKEMQT